MRRLFAFAALLISACATAPQPQPVTPQPVATSPRVHGDLLGLTAAELVQRFGSPALQIREGTSLKLQFRGRSCVLDAYLYPSQTGQGLQRVSHVDARLRSGADTDQTSCIAALTGA